MKKYIALIIFGILWFIGCSKTASKYLFEHNIVPDDYRYGDLYRLSNLKEFRVLVPHCDADFQGQKSEVTLYLAGDSFTEEGRLESDNFATKNYIRGFVAEPNKQLQLSAGKKILVIETVERHFRERFQAPWKNWDVVFQDTLIVEKPLKERLLALEVPYNTQRHESVLFSSDFVLTIKEWKSWINLKLFDKTDDKVKLFNGNLFYYLDVNPGISSAFDEVKNEEIALMVKNINLTYAYYKNLGFDEVYLSIIPNKTSILAPEMGKYNHLIERVEANQDLKMPIISVFSAFENKNYYLKSDSHWNCEGQKIWVDKVNEKILDLQ
ncbi:hypothetical protein EGI22_23955 [Lacihabitans sp. LS3-19]|uniref:hypothetical protein n=1 Tax=Lacihabitans sp. LS3-19 TaxID=2487335 RepID=UPI0020CC87DA|nr:hypothetical protein [Lacihabitans sp. LS3-19]MCP9770971.1 hypothetical protein [Lacihabitans sp. LS3-19]